MALPCAVAEDLDLDMARLFEIFFEIDRVVAEGRLGFGCAPWHSASDRSSGVRATFMPRPPPPAAALISTGKPISRAIFIASSSSVTAPGEPGTQGMPSARTVRLASILSPMMRICSGLGPMKPMS